VYYKAKDQALNNDHDYHIAAILWRKKSPIRIGVNSKKTHPAARRQYSCGPRFVHHLHAEMHALLNTDTTKNDVLEVMRWTKDGQRTMSKPCEHCMKVIRASGIKRVRYTDWDGTWTEMNLCAISMR